MRLSSRVVAALAAAAILAGNAFSQPLFPLKISQSGRYFVDQNEVPFFIHGDTPWSLIGQVSREDAELYIRDAAARGFNSLIVTLVEGYYADNAPANFYGVQPFTTSNKFTTPNEPYFEHADWVINKAAEYGLQVVLAPNYLGCCNDGWANQLRDDNSAADARWFGEWVGRRYRNFPNLMYAWGNDLDPGDLRAKMRAMAQGVKATDPNHLQTYHAWQKSALDAWDASESWLDFNITYTYEPVHIKSLEDYNRSPFLPYFLFESHYENDFGGMGAARTRQQAYTGPLSGAAGHHYGNNPIWHMNGNPADGSTNWKNHLDDEGRADMLFVRRLFESRSWFTLVPDQNHRIVIGEFSSSENYVAAALTADRSTLIAYLPRRADITVDLSQISGSEANVWWFNPRDGTANLHGVRPTTEAVTFTPPTSGDWVLVVDDTAKTLPAPGQELIASVKPMPPAQLIAD